MKKYLKTLIAVAVLIGLFAYVYLNKADFIVILQADRILTSSLFLLNSLFFLAIGLILKFILEASGLQIHLLLSTYLSVISTFGNYFLPMRGGAAVRAVYLKKNYDFKYRDFIAGMMLQLVVLLNFISVIGMLLFAPLLMQDSVQAVLFYLVLAAFFTGSLSLIFAGRFFYKFLYFRFFQKKAILFLRAWKKFSKNKECLFKIYWAHFIFFIVNTLMLYLAFYALGFFNTQSITVLWYASLLSVINFISSALVFTPGGIGIREYLMSLLSGELGQTANNMIALSLYDRMVTISFVVVFFPVCLYLINRRTQRTAYAR